MFRDDVSDNHSINSPASTTSTSSCEQLPDSGEVTCILAQLESGDPIASERLLPLIYAKLRELARAKMSLEKPGQTLDATGLVHEAYLRLVDSDESQHWNSRGHFYSAAAEAMRRILVESARRKSRVKHGGNHQRCELCDLELACPTGIVSPAELLALDEALASLAACEPQKAKLVQLRFFGGLSTEQAAQAMGISAPTAKRYWRYARAWLHAALQPEGDQP